MKLFLKQALLGAALLIPVTLTSTPAVAMSQDDSHNREEGRRYTDKSRHDEHQWNDREDKAYRMYVQEHHRKYVAFDSIKDRDRDNYWAWRHNHSDAQLKIDIH